MGLLQPDFSTASANRRCVKDVPFSSGCTGSGNPAKSRGDG